MLESDFASALEAAHVELDSEVAQRLQSYVELMWQLNQSLNLTRHTTWQQFVERDLRDCRVLSELLEPGEEVLDWGSGNGVPGIVLAIMRPDLDVTLAESVGKRSAALIQMVQELNLPIAVYQCRGEDLLGDLRFSSVVSRAVGSIAKFCRWIGPNWSAVDRLLLVKGPRWVGERGEARHLGLLKDLQIRRAAVYPLEAAGDDAVGEEAEDGAEGQGVVLEIRRKATG